MIESRKVKSTPTIPNLILRPLALLIVVIGNCSSACRIGVSFTSGCDVCKEAVLPSEALNHCIVTFLFKVLGVVCLVLSDLRPWWC